MKTKQKILTSLALVIFSTIITPSANAWIGETREQVLQDARRDKDTAGIYNVNSATVVVLYRDGSDINHVFGSNGREIAFFLYSAKRLSAEDVFKIQRTYRTTWYGTGTEGGNFTWESRSGLWMGAQRLQKYDKLAIFDSSRLNEIASRAPRSAPTPAPETATYPPPPSSPAIVPTPSENDCLPFATEAYARLKTTAYWAKMAGFMWTENTKEIGGHAVVFFQPTTDTNVFMYDKTGSYDLHTKSHDLNEIAAALNQLLRVSEIRIKSARWMESDESIKEFAGAAGKSNRQPMWSNTAANSTEQTVAYQVAYLLGFGMILALFASTAVICFLKGKPVFGVLGILALLFGGLSLWALIGACRIAKPTSWWACKKYGPEKMNIAHQRFTPSFSVG